VVDFRVAPPDLLSVRFVLVAVDLPDRMKLSERVPGRVRVILSVRVVCCPLWVRCLDGAFCRVSVLTEDTVGLFITIGLAIRFALDLPAGFLAGLVEDFGAVCESVLFLVVVVWPRRFGARAVLLLEPVFGRIGAVRTLRLLTVTGRVILVVFDELMVLFELELGVVEASLDVPPPYDLLPVFGDWVLIEDFGAAGAVRLLTVTGRVILFVVDEPIVFFELEFGDLDGL